MPFSPRPQGPTHLAIMIPWTGEKGGCSARLFPPWVSENRESFHLPAAHAIRRDSGRVRTTNSRVPATRPGLSKCAWSDKIFDRGDNARNDAVGGGRTVARHEIADRLEIRQRRPGPPDLQSGAKYFPTTRATSATSANSPRSAAAIPASIFSIYQALSAIYSSIALVASQLRERSVLSANRSSALSVASLSLRVKAAVTAHASLVGSP
jgi:hypothetical protein